MNSGRGANIVGRRGLGRRLRSFALRRRAAAEGLLALNETLLTPQNAMLVFSGLLTEGGAGFSGRAPYIPALP